MTTVTASHRRRIVIAFGCAALVFTLGLAEPPAGHAQTSSRDRMPLELWKTYPLEPRTGEAPLRSGNQSDQAQVPLPSSGEAPARRTTGPVGGRASAIGDGSSAPIAPWVLALSLVGLVVTVLVARPVAAVGRHVPGSLARFGSAVVSPVRSFATVGLADALAALAEQAPVPVEVVVPKLQLPPGVEAVAYFVCSEALANIAKYASASRVSVSVTTGDGRVRIEVEDDGLGGADPARGTGLRGLADRVEALGGTLDVESPAGGGTRVAAEVPFGGEAA